jgi:Regulator of ribonuclease activity B
MGRSNAYCLLLSIVGLLGSSGCKTRTAAKPRHQVAPVVPNGETMIQRSDLIPIFEDLARGGVAKQNLLWGYFFTDTDPQKLKTAAHALEADGYRFVEVFRDDADAGASSIWFLHVERVEHHDVDSLDARNQKLYRFAAEHGLESYDGMDVGRIDGKSLYHGR